MTSLDKLLVLSNYITMMQKDCTKLCYSLEGKNVRTKLGDGVITKIYQDGYGEFIFNVKIDKKGIISFFIREVTLIE